jgi:hypothetical protein
MTEIVLRSRLILICIEGLRKNKGHSSPEQPSKFGY